MAYIIYDNTQRNVTLDSLLAHLRDDCGLPASLGEWRFFNQVVPQVHVQTNPPVALQISDDPSYVPDEITELLDSAGEELDEKSRAAARKCDSRIEVVGCQPAQIWKTPGGGILTNAAEADLGSDEVQSVVRQVTKWVNGWCYDNVDGGWIA